MGDKSVSYKGQKKVERSGEGGVEATVSPRDHIWSLNYLLLVKSGPSFQLIMSGRLLALRTDGVDKNVW